MKSEITETGTIRCQLTIRGYDLSDPPVLCFSLPAPARVLSGGMLTGTLGGFCEILLASLPAKDTPLLLEIGFRNPEFKARNRAWLPQGPYLRLADGRIVPVELDSRGPRIRTRHADADSAPQYADLRLIPPPKLWQPGESKLPVAGFALSGPPEAQDAFAAVSQLAARTGLDPFLASDGTPITARIHGTIKPDGYNLDITPDGIRVTAAGRPGFQAAAITLLNLRGLYHGTLPCGRIEDEPRFGWRGVMLDCARHYFQPATILRLLDFMALFKLNRFHWHFADDEAFRIELACRPELARRTRFRGEKQLLPGVYGGGPGPTGGSYSQTDVATVLARANALDIEVLPEIEMPAHALACVKVYPGLRDPHDPGGVESVHGYRDNTLNPAIDASWAFLGDLATEICGTFPFRHLHIGGDEVPGGSWLQSPAMRRHMAAHGLQSVEDIQGTAMARLAGIVRARGARPCAWEEAIRGCNGGIGHDAIIFAWSGVKAGREALQAGHDVVMCPAQHTYLDMAHSNDPDDWGAAWSTPVTLEDTIAWDPAPPPAAGMPGRVLGVQANYWSEFALRDKHLDPMLAPRLLGTATMGWGPAHAIKGPALRKLAVLYSTAFRQMNWDWFDSPEPA